MRKKRNVYFWCLLCIVIFGSLSCMNNSSSKEVSQTSLENYLLNKHPNDSTNENDLIVESVETFWKLSLEGDKNNLKNYMQKAPESFWIECPSANLLKSDSPLENFSTENNLPRGRQIGISENEKESTFSLLENFSQQIQKNELELIKTRIIKSSVNEAVVKIDWKHSETGLGWLSEYLLLYRFETGWKIFMITNPLTLSEYNKTFASVDPCV